MKIETILLPIDLSDEKGSARLAEVAKREARPDGARIHVLTVIPDVGMPIVGSYFPPDFEEKARAEARERLEAWIADHGFDGFDVAADVAMGSIYRKILDRARRIAPDLIVIGAHRPEFQDYLLGSNAARVVRHADRSVYVVRHPNGA